MGDAIIFENEVGAETINNTRFPRVDRLEVVTRVRLHAHEIAPIYRVTIGLCNGTADTTQCFYTLLCALEYLDNRGDVRRTYKQSLEAAKAFSAEELEAEYRKACLLADSLASARSGHCGRVSVGRRLRSNAVSRWARSEGCGVRTSNTRHTQATDAASMRLDVMRRITALLREHGPCTAQALVAASKGTLFRTSIDVWLTQLESDAIIASELRTMSARGATAQRVYWLADGR